MVCSVSWWVWFAIAMYCIVVGAVLNSYVYRVCLEVYFEKVMYGRG